MGAWACQNKEDENLTFDVDDKVRVKDAKSFSANAMDLEHYRKEERKIVKIQATFRGHQARKDMKSPKFDERKMLKEAGLEY